MRRGDIQIGAVVDIVLKCDQGSGRLTRGTVMKILTKKPDPSPWYQSDADRRTGRQS